MTEPLSFQCACCGHSLNCHLTDGRWAACSADACPCGSWVSRYDQCEAVPSPKPAGHDHADDEACTSECTQVGGDHYVKRSIGPWNIWAEYDMNAFEGAVLKYLLRWKDKGGVEDLKKARHTLDRLIEIEESKGGTEAG